MNKKPTVKFAGHKPLKVIKKQCKAAGVGLDTRLHKDGADHVVLRSQAPDGSKRAEILYNTTNGRFFGTTPDGVQFNSDSTENDDQPWFQSLLKFFLIEKEAAR